MNTLDELIEEQRAYFSQGETLSVDFRIEKLKILRSAIKNQKDKIARALYRDLRKSEFEAFGTEILPVLNEINYAIRNLKKWAEPKIVDTPWFLRGAFGSVLNKLTGGLYQGAAESFILSEPYGNALIIVPFNYPFQLAIVPFIGALAAGNTAIIKPSSLTPNTTKVLTEIINSVFAPELVRVLDPKNTLYFDLLSKKFDYIFFTGSIETGKKILEAASKNLTPVTLELGGKSPCIVDRDCNLKNAAKAIVRGKLLNAGQTCVAPDYVAVEKGIKEKFVEALIEEIKSYLGPIPQESADFGRIINDVQFNKLKEIIQKESENLIFGGEYDECGLYVGPTLLNAEFNSFSMEKEIFGPILPVITYENFEKLIDKLKTLEKPLAAYLFSDNKTNIDIFLSRLSFGGGTINETMLHLLNEKLPFGGVGLSGMGCYHGKASFDTFSHKKSIFKKRGDKTYGFLSPADKEILSKLKKADIV